MFLIVQNIRKARRRPTKMGEMGMFSGFCIAQSAAAKCINAALPTLRRTRNTSSAPPTARARISARPILSRMSCCMKSFCEICGKRSPMFQNMKRSSFRMPPRAICGTEMRSLFGSVKRWQRQTRLFFVLSLTGLKFPVLTRNPERGKPPSSITSSVHLTSHGQSKMPATQVKERRTA